MQVASLLLFKTYPLLETPLMLGRAGLGVEEQSRRTGNHWRRVVDDGPVVPGQPRRGDPGAGGPNRVAVDAG